MNLLKKPILKTQWALYIGKGKNYINCILKKYGYDYTVNYIKEHAGLV